jgi:hypothetical protein
MPIYQTDDTDQPGSTNNAESHNDELDKIPMGSKTRSSWQHTATVGEKELETALSSRFHENGFHLITKQTNKPNSAGVITQYRKCSAFRRYNCQFEVRIQKLGDEDHSCVISSKGIHSHSMVGGEIVSPSKQPARGLPPELKDMVSVAVCQRKRPGNIYREIKNKFPKSTVTAAQLYTRIKYVRKKDGTVLEGKTLGHIFEWCENHELKEDSDYDVVGVLPGWEVTTVDGVDIVSITITSKLLLRNIVLQCSGHQPSFFSADGTYKLLVNGYPVIVFGTTDGEHRYKPVSVTISSGETESDYSRVFQAIKNACLGFLDFIFTPSFAMADSAPAIHNAMVKVFPGVKVAKCWAHVARGLPPQKSSFSSQQRYEEFFGDVRKLHSFISDETFDFARSLFISKWSSKTKEKKGFQWFNEWWLTDVKCRWFAGATGPGLQVVNNSQERGNRSLKDYVTNHLRMALGEFIQSLFEELQFHTNESSVFPFITTPKCGRPTWIGAQIWLKECGAYVQTGHRKDTYCVPSSAYLAAHKEVHGTVKLGVLRKDMNIWSRKEQTPKPDEDLNAYHARVTSFYDLQKLPSPCGPSWFSCECVEYYKTSICKHTLGQTIQLNLVKVPPNRMGKTIESKKSRGRPAAVGDCLER